MGIGAYPQKQQNFLISRRQKWLVVGNRLESQAELKEISLKQRLECFSFWFTEKNLSPTVPFCYQWVNLSFKTKTWMLLFLITEKNLPPMVPFCYRWVDLASVKRVRFIWMISKITIPPALAVQGWIFNEYENTDSRQARLKFPTTENFIEPFSNSGLDLAGFRLSILQLYNKGLCLVINKICR